MNLLITPDYFIIKKDNEDIVYKPIKTFEELIKNTPVDKDIATIDNIKKCFTCKELKSLTNYNKSGRGYRSDCNECVKKIETIIPPTKNCNDCLKELPMDDFYNSKRHKYGKENRCKACSKIYQKEKLSPELKEKKRARSKRQYETHREEQKQYSKNHYNKYKLQYKEIRDRKKLISLLPKSLDQELTCATTPPLV